MFYLNLLIGVFRGPFSVSNCATTYEEFQFKFWTSTEMSPGEFNKCYAHIDESQLPSCGTEDIPIGSSATTACRIEGMHTDSDSLQNPTVTAPCENSNVEENSQASTSCAKQTNDKIILSYNQNLQETFSRKLKVTGGEDERLNGDFHLSKLVLNGRPVYVKEGEGYIYFKPDNYGWRLATGQYNGRSVSTEHSEYASKRDISTHFKNNMYTYCFL